jgi:hypothetical protein
MGTMTSDKQVNFSHELAQGKQHDTPLSSLMDSTLSPKVKTTKGKKNWGAPPIRNTSRVKGRARAPRWDYEE